MYVKLKEVREYKSKKHPAGTILHVGDDLGRKLVSIHAAKISTQEAFENAEEISPAKKSLSTMNRDELIVEATGLDIEIMDGMTKDALKSAIKAKTEEA